MMVAQRSGRSNLRNIVDNMTVQRHKLYRPGASKISCATLSHINEDKPYQPYKALFGRMLSCCQVAAPSHNFRFKNKLYSLNTTTIDLCLSAFPWAEFRSTKGAIILLHVGLNHEGYLPESITVTDGKTHGTTAARAMNLPQSSIVVVDKGHNDYAGYKQLMDKDIVFVTPLKNNAKYRVINPAVFYAGLIASKLTQSTQQILRVLQPNLF